MAKFWRYQDREQYNRQKAGDILKRNPLPERAPREPVAPLGPQPAPPQPRPSLLRPSTWPTVSGIPGGAGIAKTPWMQSLMGAVGGPEAAERAEPAVAWQRWLSSLTREQVAQPLAGFISGAGALPGFPGAAARWGAEVGRAVKGGATLGAGFAEAGATGRRLWQEVDMPAVPRMAVETLLDPLGVGGAIVAAPFMGAAGVAGVLGKLYMAVDVADMGAYLASATPEELGGVLLLMGAAKLPAAVSKLVRKAWPGVEKVARELPGAARRFAAEEVGAAEIPGRPRLPEPPDEAARRAREAQEAAGQRRLGAPEAPPAEYERVGPPPSLAVHYGDTGGADATARPEGIIVNQEKWAALSARARAHTLAHEVSHQTIEEYLFHRPSLWDEPARLLQTGTQPETAPEWKRGLPIFSGVHEKLNEAYNDAIASYLMEPGHGDLSPGLQDWVARTIRLAGYTEEQLRGTVEEGLRTLRMPEAPPVRAPAGPPARPLPAEAAVPEARRRMGDRSLAPPEVAQARAEMGTLADYTDRRSFGEFLGSGTRHYRSAVDQQLWTGRAVPVYRASDVETSLTSGSYVTQSRVYAEQHLQSVLGGRGQILEATARADELIPVSPNEFWYAPSAARAARPPAGPAVPPAGQPAAQPVPGAPGILGGPVTPGMGAAVGQPIQPPIAGRGVQITPGGPAAGAVPPTVPPVTGPLTVPPTQLPLWGADNLDLMRTALKWPKPTIKQKLASAVYKFTTGWLDKVAPLKALQRQTGVEVYNLARILPGMQVAGESYARQYVRPIWQSLGDEIDNAEVYAHLRRALDFREWSPTGKLPGGVQNAAEGLVRLERELGPERIADIHAALEEIWRLNDELILKPLRDEGFPVAKFYDIIKAKWPHYIAWYRQDFEWDEAFRVGPGRQVANMTERVLKRMKIEGSEKRLTSGLARFEAEVIRTPGRIAKNQTARALVRGLQALDAMDGGTRAVRDVPTRTVDRGVVRYWEDGEQQVWQVPAAMERVAKGFDAEPANALMQMLNRASQPLRLGAVVYNPAFVPVNALRDTLSAWITEGLVPFGRQWWGSLVTTIAKNTDWHRGARAGAFLSGFTENVARTTELGRAKRLGKITLKSVGDLVLLVPRLTARANEIVEQTTRLAVFRKLTAEGVPELEAAVRSREVSLDFSKSGNIGRMVNMIVPFFNAGIQGAAKTVDLVAKHPGRTLLRASPLMMISVMTYLWNQRYETSNMIPEYEHALNFVLQVGEGEKKPDPRYPMQKPEVFPIYVKLPKGPMVAGLMAPVEALLRIAFAQDDRSVVEHLLQAAGEVVRSQSPVGPDVGSLLPPVLGTLLQLQVNKDFFRGEAIVPEWEETRPPEARYGPEATRQAIALGQKFKVSPRLIDFTVRDVAGGGGRTAGWLLDVALGALGYQPSVPGEARRQPLAREEAISRAPLARRFYGTRRTQQERMAYQKMDVALEDARRGLYESQEAARFGMGVTPPGRTATIEGVPYELAPEQRTEMLRQAAPLVEFGFAELTRRPFYQEKDDLERRGLLDMVRRKVQGNVRDQVLAGLTGMMPGPTWTQADIVRLLDATELLEEYQAIPQYIGLSEEQTQAANAAMGKYNAMRRANPMIPPDVTRSLLAQQDPRAVVLMEMAYSRRNPARRYFWAMHPLLSVFYSDLTEEEVEMVSPMSQMQGQETRLPSWAAVA